MKKLLSLLTLVCLMTLSITPLYASENELGITFEGDSQKFIVFEGNENNSSFQDMMPGEKKTQTITIQNNDYKALRFYVRVDNDQMLDNNQTSQRIVYDLEFKNNNEVFFNGRVGGTENTGKDNLSENYMLTTLKKGESTTLDMTIQINGLSMDNSYQGSVGSLGLVLGVEVELDNPVLEIIKKVPVVNLIPGVKTGDMSALELLAGVIVISGIIIIFLGKKGKKDENKK